MQWEKGQRVRLSARGRQTYTRSDPAREGVVVAFSDYRTAYRILWDGCKSDQCINEVFLEPVDYG